MNQKHMCKLNHAAALKSFLPPLHPSGKFWPKFFRSLRLLLALDEKNLRCIRFFKTTSSMRIEQRTYFRSPYWFVIHPFSKMSVFIERLFLILFIERWLFFITIFDRPHWVVVLHYVRDFLHVLIIISFFLTGYTDRKARKIIIFPKLIAKRYLKSYFFIDLYVLLEDNCDSVIQAIYIWVKENVSWERTSIALSIIIPLSVISIICYILRMKTALNIIKFNAASLGFGFRTIFVSSHLFVFIFVLHFYTFQFYNIPWIIYHFYGDLPEDSWIAIRKLNVRAYTFNSYKEGFLIVLSYFLGSNYADIIQQPNEKLLLFIYSITGRLYVLTIIGKVLVYFGLGDTGESQYECLLLQLDNYMKAMDVPSHLQAQIFERFKFNYQKKYFNVQELMETLTDQLKNELFMLGAKKLIARNGFLRNLNSSKLGLLFAYMESDTYAKEEIIMGDLRERTHTYFISSGSVSAFASDGLELFNLHDGDVFGLLGLSSLASYESFYSFRFVAKETTEVYSVNKKWIKMILDSTPKLGQYFDKKATECMDKITEAYKIKEKSGLLFSYMKKGTILEHRRLRNIVLKD